MGVSQHDHILDIARDGFAHRGIAATTIQDIADRAGVSKASVLYHFSSKDQLVDAALEPSLEALSELLDSLVDDPLSSAESQRAFLERFVDFLINHRLAAHIVVSHPYLADESKSLGRATVLMGLLAERVSQAGLGDFDRLRFGVAVSGATYALVSAGQLGVEQMSNDELRPMLTEVLREMTGLPAPSEQVSS